MEFFSHMRCCAAALPYACPRSGAMHVRRFGSHVEVLTPAKINLFLEVLGKRPDGYHEIETLMAAVTIYDTLVFVPHSGGEIKLDCRWAMGLASADVYRRQATDGAGEAIYGDIPAGRDNLVVRAVELIREAAGLRAGAIIHLIKRVPAAAGLGGASSDAAAALVAVNEAWQLGWQHERLVEIAAIIGSDVPFFLKSGAAICRGRGEQTQAVPIPRLQLAIVRPPVGLSTPRVYQACHPTATRAGIVRLMEALVRGDASAAGRQLLNGLQQPAASLTLWIDRLQQEFERVDVVGHQMSGSGSSYFGLCRSARHARRVASRLSARQIGTVFAATTAVA